MARLSSGGPTTIWIILNSRMCPVKFLPADDASHLVVCSALNNLGCKCQRYWRGRSLIAIISQSTDVVKQTTLYIFRITRAGLVNICYLRKYIDFIRYEGKGHTKFFFIDECIHTMLTNKSRLNVCGHLIELYLNNL